MGSRILPNAFGRGNYAFLLFSSKRAIRSEGPVKTFSLRGLEDSPPYYHDGRLPTLEDAVQFFDIVLGTGLTAGEKKDLVAYRRAL